MNVIIWLIPYLSMLMTQHSIWHWRQMRIYLNGISRSYHVNVLQIKAHSNKYMSILATSSFCWNFSFSFSFGFGSWAWTYTHTSHRIQWDILNATKILNLSGEENTDARIKLKWCQIDKVTQIHEHRSVRVFAAVSFCFRFYFW